MTSSTQIQDYLNQVQREFESGIAAEHAYRPALEALLEAAGEDLNAVNDPRRTEIGAPDFVVLRDDLPVGIVEAKDIGADLDRVERSGQMVRYLPFGNVILTDYLEFRWYVNGEHVETVRVAEVRKGKIAPLRDHFAALGSLLRRFAQARPPKVTSARELAERMADLAREIRLLIQADLESDSPSPELTTQHAAFEETLIPGLTRAQFADMYAQTLAYGLFAARVNRPGEGFSRPVAAHHIPRTNPFLRRLFHSAEFSAGDRVTWLVDRLADLLANTDIDAVLEGFGRSTRQEDPVVHFYETFLSHYDPALRERRGVYYTPEPVVSYIVRSVDHLLREKFNRPAGLADEHTLILDPATGTGTFLYFVIQQIFEAMGSNRGMWDAYVRENLLRRVFGFELLMAPYTIAHMKLGLELARMGYNLHGDERLRVYLTNTLEQEVKEGHTELIASYLVAEAREAAEVKREQPIMVVLGNPPYSGHSANASTKTVNIAEGQEYIAGWTAGADGRAAPVMRTAARALTGVEQPNFIGRLLRDYYFVDGRPLGERNPKWLQDDYVKFIRFAQWRIERTGEGILAFISNNGYLDNPTFRGMRQQLLRAFDEIYILDLHGSSRKKETAPDGGPDENVFDIMQGVTIGIFVRRASPLAPHHASPLAPLHQNGEGKRGRGLRGEARVYHADLWGRRGDKYRFLNEAALPDVEWTALQPDAPFYLFVPQDVDVRAEYEQAWKITDAMPVNVLGFQTHRDSFAIDFDREVMRQRIADMRDDRLTDDQFREKYGVTDNRGWQLSRARAALRSREDWEAPLIRCAYRPFDNRWCYFSEIVMDRPRRELLDHVAGRENLCLNLVRQTKMEVWQHTLVSNSPTPAVYVELKDGSSVFPLYLYPDPAELFSTSLWPPGKDGRRPNLNTDFVRAMEKRLGLRFEPHPLTPGPFSPLHLDGEGPGVRPRGEGPGVRRVAPGLWEMLKPLARQMRRNPTPAEDRLWQELRDRRLAGAKFRRQHALDRFILDFYCAEAALVIEVDGPVHDYTPEEDAIRQQFLEAQGLRVLRFSNDAVLHDTGRVLAEIAAALQPHPLTPGPFSPLHLDGEGPGVRHGEGPGVRRGEAFGPEDIFHYAYAVFHSPAYRERYAEFLRIDFPRLPLTSDVALFRALCAAGEELVGLHLLERVPQPFTGYPVAGDHVVEPGYPKYVPPRDGPGGEAGRVYINRTQYFENVPPEVWEFHIGGYQVCDKWLKDRRGRALSPAEIRHYEQIVVALSETIRLMDAIDALIDEGGGFPLT